MIDTHSTTIRSFNFDEAALLGPLESLSSPKVKTTAQEVIFEIISQDPTKPTLKELDILLLRLEREWNVIKPTKAALECYEIALNSLETLYELNRLRPLEASSEEIPNKKASADTVVRSSAQPDLERLWEIIEILEEKAPIFDLDPIIALMPQQLTQAVSVEEHFPAELKNPEDNLDQSIISFISMINEKTIDPAIIDPTPLLRELEKLWQSYNSADADECPIPKFKSILTSLIELYTILKHPFPPELLALRPAIYGSSRK